MLTQEPPIANAPKLTSPEMLHRFHGVAYDAEMYVNQFHSTRDESTKVDHEPGSSTLDQLWADDTEYSN